MSHPALSPRPLTVAALKLKPRLGVVLVLAVTLVGAAWFIPQPAIALTMLTIGFTFLSLAGLVTLLSLRHRLAERGFANAVESFVAQDAAPVFITDADGMIGFLNAAARDRFNTRGGDTLTNALGDLFASPAAVLYRLQNRAQAKGAAREDLVLRRGHIRLSVHQMGEEGYLWRLEDLSERGPAGRTGENISLPMMTVSKTGTILFMNEALRRLLGGRETTLDRVFTELPVRPGEVMQVSGKDGPVKTLVSEIASSAGRREIYLLPEPENRMVDPAEWGVVDGLPVPLLKLAADGRITMANRRARELLADDGAIGTLLSDQVEGLGRPVSDWLREAHTGRHLGRSEVVRAVKPEQETYLQISLGQVSEPEGPSLVAVLNDATQFKTLEAQFVQSQKMQAIGQLAGGVAHDFNNLLTAIMGHGDLLLLRHGDKGDPDYADLSQIQQNANRAAALVGQLLAFSRKQTLRPEVLDLDDVLGDLTHLLNRLVGEKVLLDLSHGHALLPIRADKRQLEQVLMNLVVNARDAMPEGGKIRIETRNVILDTALERDRATVPAGEYVTIKVSDQGTGIPPDKLQKVFEPFYTTKQAGKGTGLGLSMAYGIVKQTGGFIFLDSVVGSGTSFTLYFPVHHATASETVAAGAGIDAPAQHETLSVSLPHSPVHEASIPSDTLQEKWSAEAVEPLSGSDGTDEIQGEDPLTLARDTDHLVAALLDEEEGASPPIDRSAVLDEDSASEARRRTEPAKPAGPATPTDSGLHMADGSDPTGAADGETPTLRAGSDPVPSAPLGAREASPDRASPDPDGKETLPRPTHPASPPERGIVLLVEDEAPVRAFASRALRMRGFTVLEAENAEEALRTLEDESLNVDVFVTDVIMPGMDGPTWVTRALEDRPGVKVVFVSGYAEDSIAEHQARIPNSVFLPKPFSLSELTAMVQKQVH